MRRVIGSLWLGIAGILWTNTSLMADAVSNLRLGTQFQQWGEEASAQIEKDFYASKPYFYANNIEVKEGKVKKSGPAFMWACGVQLSTLAEAAKVEPDAYTSRLRAYVRALDVYWQGNNPLGGYDVLPCPKPLDRYYDDNVWVVLALIKAYEATQDKKFLLKARATMKFVLSGEDNKLGGGIYWRESPAREAKHTCSTAPTIVAALKFYQISGDKADLDTGLRLYDWIRGHLQDEDGLYWDNINLNGNIGKAKYSYNSALMIRASCLLYEITKDQKYLDEAKRVGQAALDKWVRSDGSADDGGRFAHLLLGSFLALSRVDNNSQWLDAADRMVQFVHDNLRDADGRYPGSWSKKSDQPVSKFELLDEASVAHAYWETADAHLNAKQ